MRFALATTIAALAVLASAAPRHVERKVGMAIPITKRSALTDVNKIVDVQALKGHVASANAKVLRGFDNYYKITGSRHPAALKGFQKRDTGADPLTTKDNKLWFGTISVGTPVQNFTVDFDTGSSDLILPGVKCTSNCEGHKSYNPADSSTSLDLGREFTLSYEDNSTASGGLFSDTVIVSGLHAIDQTLGVATAYSSKLSLDNFIADGIMGMAFQSISAYNASPVIETMAYDGTLDNAQFSFKLASSGSELYLGGANEALYVHQFNWTDVTQEGFWQVNMGAILVNETYTEVLTNIDSIIDTGASLIIGEPSQVKALYDAAGGRAAPSTIGEGYYTFPCNSFPEVRFVFASVPYLISPDTLNLGRLSKDSNDCVSGIIGQSSSSGSSLWIIGDVFLQNVYTSFNYGLLQVGFAELA